MTIRRGKTEENNGLRALIDELYARLNRAVTPGGETPLYSVVLRPGDTSGAKNVFTSWASLYAATASIQGGVRVGFDDSLGAIAIPAGTYHIDGWVWVNDAPAATLTIDAGVTLVYQNLFVDGMTITCDATSDVTVCTTAGGEVNLYILDGSILNCTAAGRFLSTGDATAFAFVTIYPSCGIGDGTHAVFHGFAGSTFETFQSGGQFSDNAQTGGTLDYDMSCLVNPSNQFGNGVGLIALDQSPSVSFAPGGPSGGPTVFTTWASLYAVMSGAVGGGSRGVQVQVLVDDRNGACHITAGGPYNLDNWTLTGVASFLDVRGTAALTIDVGATIDGSADRTLNLNDLDITVVATSTVCTVAADAEFNLNLVGTGIVCTGGAPMFTVSEVGDGGFLIIFAEAFAKIGDGTNEVISSGTAPGFATIDAESGSHITAGSISAGVLSWDQSVEIDIRASSAFTLIPQGRTLVFRPEVDNGIVTAAATVDWIAGQKQKVTLDGSPATVFTFDAPQGTTNVLLKVIQGAGGSHTATWPATVKWPGGTAPTLSTAAGAIDIVSFYFDGTNYFGVASLAFA